MAESPQHFQDLLERLAAEHDREIRELQAEISRLNGSLDGRSLVIDEPCLQRNNLVFSDIQDLAPARGGSPCSSAPGSGPPDEEALAAAFAVATDLRSDTGLTAASATWTAEPRKPRKDADTAVDHQALALWDALLKYGREQVKTADLPKVHKKWQVDSKSDFGYKMKNLVVHRRSLPVFMAHKNLSPDDQGTDTRFVMWALRACLPSIPTHPSSKTRLLWDFIGIMLLLHDLVMIPMSMFNSDVTGLPMEYENFLDTLDYFSASFWTSDIVMNFFTGYHSTSGFVEMKMTLIAIHYLQSWFTLDICIVGVDWTMTALNHGGPTDFMRLGKTASRLTRLVRLLRFMKMNKHMSELLARINSEYILTVIGLMKLVVLIVILNHYIACFWYGLSKNIKGAEETWVNYYLIRNGKYDLAYSYATSLHWSLTQFTPASMEIFPHNAYERAFNVVVIICGFVIFSSFVSSITGAMNHIRNINARAVEQDSMIRHYFSENNIPHSLASRVWHFVRQKRVSGKRLRAEELPFLQQLPVRLRDELRQEVYTPHLSGHPLLRTCWRVCPAAVRKMCIKAIAEVSLAAGKNLNTDNDGATKMVFVLIGSLEFHSFAAEEEDMECPRVERGSWACEAALWADRATLEGHLVASPGGADLLLLDAEAFRNIALEFAETSDLLVRYSKIFMERFAAAMLEEDAVRDNVFFNDIDEAKEMTRAAEGDTDASSSLLSSFALRASTTHPRASTTHPRASTSGGKSQAAMEPEPSPSVLQSELLLMPVLSADRDQVHSVQAVLSSPFDEDSKQAGRTKSTSTNVVEVESCWGPEPAREYREQSI